MEIFELKKIILYEFYDFILVIAGAIPAALIRWHINNNLLVNLTGSLIIGLLLGSSLKRPFKLFVGVGFCGSLTTFSSWIMESFQLILHGSFLDAIALTLFSLILALLSAAFGYWIGKQVKLICFP